MKSGLQLVELVQSGQLRDQNVLILGGGSNVLFLEDWAGIVLKNEVMGCRINAHPEDDNKVLLQCGGGENWHGVVQFALENGAYGMENLALIPGTVGASPIQNIGAYGVELKDVFYSLEAVNMDKGEVKVFSKEECGFGYRYSVFKGEEKGKWMITEVTYVLDKTPSPKTGYGALQETLTQHGVTGIPSPKDVFEAVIAVRRSKLPDPNVIGNAGSFFKNPSIPEAQALALKEKYEGLSIYPGSEAGTLKVPAGWLVEASGLKGARRGNVGVHEKQALVLVNYGGGTGREIWALAMEVQKAVMAKFGIMLEPEVNVIGKV